MSSSGSAIPGSGWFTFFRVQFAGRSLLPCQPLSAGSSTGSGSRGARERTGRDCRSSLFLWCFPSLCSHPPATNSETLWGPLQRCHNILSGIGQSCFNPTHRDVKTPFRQWGHGFDDVLHFLVATSAPKRVADFMGAFFGPVRIITMKIWHSARNRLYNQPASDF